MNKFRAKEATDGTAEHDRVNNLLKVDANLLKFEPTKLPPRF